MSLLIKNGHLIDPASNRSETADVLIRGKRIEAIGKNLDGDKVLDASGCIVCPGLVDIHVHFREPGYETKETIESGCRAAARGGFTSVVTMPNTDPPIDDAGLVEFVYRRAHEVGCVNVYPAACATKGRAGQEMTEMAELKAVGAVAVTDDGSDIDSSWVLRRVLEYADMCGLVYLAHCEDRSLSEEGVMNEGYNSTRLGLPGMPKAMEESRVDRNVRLAELTGARLHIQHISTAGSVAIIRDAKTRGVRVTCETAPHYFTLTDDALADFGTNAKMNPPLREAVDVAAIKQGLADGTIDCIATDHAPHTITDKDVEFQLAPFGVVGLETALALTLAELVESGVLTIERALALLTCAPAALLGLAAGRLSEGGPADVTVLDPNAEHAVDPKAFASLARNTPLAGRTVRGQVRATVREGKVVYRSDE